MAIVVAILVAHALINVPINQQLGYWSLVLTGAVVWALAAAGVI